MVRDVLQSHRERVKNYEFCQRLTTGRMKLNQFTRLASDDCSKSEDVEDFYGTPIDSLKILTRGFWARVCLM